MNPVSESLEVQVVVFLIVLGLFERGPRRSWLRIRSFGRALRS